MQQLCDDCGRTHNHRRITANYQLKTVKGVLISAYTHQQKPKYTHQAAETPPFSAQERYHTTSRATRPTKPKTKVDEQSPSPSPSNLTGRFAPRGK